MGSIGAIIMSGFALIWCGVALYPWFGVFNLGLVPPALVTAAIVWRAVRAARWGSGARRGTVIGWASAAEGLAIPIVVTALHNFHLDHAVVPAIAIIVGLHFVPMAYALPFPRFYVLAAILTVVGIAALLIPWPLRVAVVGVTAALVLWTASIAAVRSKAAP